MSKDTKLIILRGPSGSGKSTIAKLIFNSAQRKTVLIEQDYYRFIFKPAGGGNKLNSPTIHKMILHNTLDALRDGYDVILEGILSVRSYGELLEQIFQQHQTNNYIFYFDISLSETFKRHETRPDKHLQFGETEMREWYPNSNRSNHKFEHIIPEQFSIEESIKFIKQTAN